MSGDLMAADGVTPAAAARLAEFVNTRHADSDQLGTPEQLAQWLRAHGLPAATVTEADLHRAHRVREGVRALLARNNAAPVRSPWGDGLDPAARDHLADLTAELPLTLDITADPPRLIPHPTAPVDRAMATLLADIATATAAGTWIRLKVCREPSCRWAFYDHSRNRGRTWCSMNVCGNRVKVRAAHRRRTTGVVQRDAR